MLLHRNRVIGTAFNGCIIGDNHALEAIHTADADNQTSCRYTIVAVHAVARKLANLEEG